MTIHPNFVQNNYIYLSYAHGTEEANRLRVVRARLNETGIESTEIIFESAQTKNGSSHFGSRFARLPDNTLVFSVGD
ncbi:PQQ-dependent sugar dehydrogenase [bacterium]|nr:PQQ-dependent sugar dehydrogenase [bacterium]